MNTDYDKRVTESALEGMVRRAEEAGKGGSVVRGAEIIARAVMYGFRVLAEALKPERTAEEDPDGN